MYNFKTFLHEMADSAAFLGVLFSVAGLFGRHHFFLELFTQLKLPLAICFSGYVVFKLLLKKRKTALLATIPLLINATPPMLLLLPQKQQEAPVSPVSVTILQANVRTSNHKATPLINLVASLDPDVIVLQETNERWLRDLDELKKQYPVFATHPRADNFGAAVFCKQTNAVATIEFLNDAEQLPLSKVVIPYENKKITVFGMHPLAPLTPSLWQGRNRHTRKTAHKLAATDGAVILTGDFNNTPWSSYYRELLKTSALLDASQGRGPLPTWPALRALTLLPLDHCLHSETVIIEKRRRGTKIGSDHYPLIIKALF